MRNAGALRLARSGATQQTIADRLGCTRQAAQQWIAGANKPSKVRRGELLAAFEIPVEAWDEELPTSPAAPDSAPESEPRPTKLPSTALGKMESVEGILMQQMAKVSEDPSATPAEICKVGRDCMAALDIIARRRGEGGTDMPKWLRSSQWAQIVRAVMAALEPYPEGAARFAGEMRRLEKLANE